MRQIVGAAPKLHKMGILRQTWVILEMWSWKDGESVLKSKALWDNWFVVSR